MDNVVWKTTLDKVVKGWLEGPLSDAQLVSRVGANLVPSHRFGLRQNGEVRVIDDLSGLLINSTVVCEKLVLQDIDAHSSSYVRGFGMQGPSRVPSASYFADPFQGGMLWMSGMHCK
eukprot:6254250-Amphidinium_carterae.1